jgi:hypothetical protein
MVVPFFNGYPTISIINNKGKHKAIKTLVGPPNRAHS